MKKYILPLLIITIFIVPGSSTEARSFAGKACPASQQLTQNLHSGAYNGRYHSYTRGIVTQAHLLQKHLNRLGFSSGIEDGKLGPISTAAIKRMQRFLGTKPDGFVGPLTRALLNNSCEDDLSIDTFTRVETVEAENQDFEHPTVQTKSIFLDKLGIRGDAGKLIFDGHAELYDAKNVKTFFVYGTSVNFLPIENTYDSYDDILVTDGIKKIFHTSVNDSLSAVTFSKSINPTNHELSLPNYVLACIEYKDNENNTQLRCGEPRLFDYRDEEYKASLMASDAFAKTLISQGRAIAEIHKNNTGTYIGAISEIENKNTINGIYKLVYSAQDNSYTYYSRLKGSAETIFCADSTGYIGVMNNRYNPYQFGIRCLY